MAKRRRRRRRKNVGNGGKPWPMGEARGKLVAQVSQTISVYLPSTVAVYVAENADRLGVTKSTYLRLALRVALPGAKWPPHGGVVTVTGSRHAGLTAGIEEGIRGKPSEDVLGAEPDVEHDLGWNENDPPLDWTDIGTDDSGAPAPETDTEGVDSEPDPLELDAPGVGLGAEDMDDDLPSPELPPNGGQDPDLDEEDPFDAYWNSHNSQ